MKKMIGFSLVALALTACGAVWASGFDADVMSVGLDALALSPILDAGLGFGMAGMIVNKSSLNTIFTGLKTIFNNALKATPGDWQKTAMEVISNSKSEDYAWLERFPALRKWVGEKHVKALEAGKFTVVNEDYEATIAVSRNDIEDDSIGIYNTQSQMAGDSAAELHDIILDELKNDAFIKPGIDGQFFYDADHEVNGVSVSNKLTAVLSSATAATAAASIGAARTAMMNFKDEEGKPLRLIPDTLEVPPALVDVANKLMTAEKLDDGSQNPYKGTAEVLLNPGLTSSTAWMLHNTKKAIKPFIIQMRKRPVFVSQTDMENPDVFMKAEYKFGVEARAAGVYGFWQTSVGSDGSV